MTLSVAWLQAGTYTAAQDRQVIEALASAGVVDKAGSHFQVTQRGAGANMSVDVAAGQAFVTGTDASNQGRYMARSTAVENRVIGAAPGAGLARLDRVVVRVSDAAHGGDGTAKVEVVAGTPNASPSLPALPASAIHLAQVRVDNGDVSVLDAKITDGRAQATPAMPLEMGTPVEIGTALGPGTSALPAAADHVHTIDATAFPGNALPAAVVLARAGLRIRRVADHVAGAGTKTLTWDTEDEDALNMIAVPSDTVTVPTGYGGIWAITVRYWDNGGGYMALLKNEANFLQFQRPPTQLEPVTGLFPLAEGDALRATWWTSGGATLSEAELYMWRLMA